MAEIKTLKPSLSPKPTADRKPSMNEELDNLKSRFENLLSTLDIVDQVRIFSSWIYVDQIRIHSGLR